MLLCKLLSTCYTKTLMFMVIYIIMSEKEKLCCTCHSYYTRMELNTMLRLCGLPTKKNNNNHIIKIY